MIKITNPNEVAKKLVKAVDKLGFPIDEGIFRSVVILNSLGYKTDGSCEGHSDRYNTYPWIDIIWNEEITPEYYNSSLNFFYKYLFQDLKEFYENRKVPDNQSLIFTKFDSKKVSIRLSSKGNRNCYTNSSEKLQLYLTELIDFCEFLNQKYNLNY